MTDVLYEVADHIATITLNRPDRLNAITGPMLDGIAEHLWAAEADRSVRVVVVTGAGRGFCSGLDLKSAGEGGLGIEPGKVPLAQHPPITLRRIDTPTICRLNGVAAGYGMDLALGCDLVIASDQARLIPPVTRGVIPESGGTWLLPRLLGWHKACEVALLGRHLDAHDIERLGLANRVVPHDQLDDEVDQWATELAGSPPLAVAAAKRTMRLGLDTPFEANFHHVLSEVMGLFHTADFREAVAAFAEDREPDYEGR